MSNQGSIFTCCCPFGTDMQSLADNADPKQFSPILNLDNFIADWAYESAKKAHNVDKSLCAPKFPKRKDVDITIMWDQVTFKHYGADEFSKQSAGQVAIEANGNNDGDGIMLNKVNNPLRGGATERDEMKGMHHETFSVKYDNTTNAECEVNLTSERTVKASYEVDVHRSVQTGHNLQLSFELGGEEAPAKLEAAYEFNKMLEEYKGEKKTEEMETKLSTDCPVKVKPLHRAEANFVTHYQNFKKTLHIRSDFYGTITAAISGKKKGRNGKKFYKSTSKEVGAVFKSLLANSEDTPLNQADIKVNEDTLVVSYRSSATFCSSYGVNQQVEIKQIPIKDLPAQ